MRKKNLKNDLKIKNKKLNGDLIYYKKNQKK